MVVNQDFNIELMLEYFFLAWTFDGFVRPYYIWLFSLSGFFLIIVFNLAISGSRGKDEEYVSVIIKKEEDSI